MAEVKFKVPDEKFDVAFSYASEDYEWAKQLDDALRDWKVPVFNYRTPEGDAALLGKNLFDELAKIYRRTPFCVVFVSHDYVKKFWTQDEFESINKAALKKRDYLIPVFLDHDAKLEGLDAGKREENTGRDADALRKRAVSIAHNVAKYKETRRRHRIQAAIAALIAILAVIGVLLYLTRPSNTHVAMTGADSAHIYARVWNTGSKPSQLVSYRLKFGGLPVGGGDNATVNEAELRLSDDHRGKDTNVIENDRPVTIGLFLDELSGLPKPGRPERYSADEILQQLNDDLVTLEIRVKESNDKTPGLMHTRSASIPAKKLEAFIEGRMR